MASRPFRPLCRTIDNDCRASRRVRNPSRLSPRLEAIFSQRPRTVEATITQAREVDSHRELDTREVGLRIGFSSSRKDTGPAVQLPLLRCEQNSHIQPLSRKMFGRAPRPGVCRGGQPSVARHERPTDHRELTCFRPERPSADPVPILAEIMCRNRAPTLARAPAIEARTWDAVRRQEGTCGVRFRH